MDEDTIRVAVGYAFCKLILRECLRTRIEAWLLESMDLWINHIM